MTRFVMLLLAGLVAAAATAAPAMAQTAKSRLNAILERGTVRVGTTGDYQPMSFRDPATKELRGHQIDAATKLAQDMGVKVEFVLTDWKTLISGLVADKYDIVMTGTNMNVARAKAVGFTTPWGRNAFVPLVLQQNKGKYKDWADLNDAKVAVGYNLGTAFEQFVQVELPKATPKKVESPARDWQELLAGRVDVTISSLIEAAALTQQHPQIAKLFEDRPKNAVAMSFLVPIEDMIWLNFLNNWIVINKESGFFDELARKWRVAANQ